ncbi:MAG: copper resistance protein CopZ [Paenibacillus sp.]|jgi:copper chaperone CopZ|nr:copper resistance protein CopZ [Paenibacillus sp.]
MQQATLKVEGMTCRSCIRTIESALTAIGVEGKVNIEGGVVDVKFDDTNVQLSHIQDLIEKKGYQVVA